VLFSRLRAEVTGSNLGPSMLDVHPSGQRLVRDLLHADGISLPAEQTDKATTTPTQLHADALLFVAASVIHQQHEHALNQFWHFSGHKLACLWRAVMLRPMRAHPRTQVVPGQATNVQGECLGVSRGASRRVYCSEANNADKDLIALIRATLPSEHRAFQFTTAQVNRGLRPKRHRDGANVGSSLTIAIGPYVGGTLWQATSASPTCCARDAMHLPPWSWQKMNGSFLHATSPHCGQRCSIVLFTHEAIMVPLPDVAAIAGSRARPCHQSK
jgi:hypothetical protein